MLHSLKHVGTRVLLNAYIPARALQCSQSAIVRTRSLRLIVSTVLTQAHCGHTPYRNVLIGGEAIRKAWP